MVTEEMGVELLSAEILSLSADAVSSSLEIEDPIFGQPSKIDQKVVHCKKQV